MTTASDDLELRPANAADFDWLNALYEESLRPHVEANNQGAWDAHRFKQLFEPTCLQVVTLAGEDIGLLKLEERPDGVYLAEIELLARHRNRGLGARLLRRIIADVHASDQPVLLRCLRANPARRLYERLGFGIYKSDESAHYMWLRPPAWDRALPPT